MPSWSVDSSDGHTGLYEWLGARLEAAYSSPDPRLEADSPRPVPERVARFRAGLPVAVAAWWLDGHGARAAGFMGVLPSDRGARARVYVVGPDDSVTQGDGLIA